MTTQQTQHDLSNRALLEGLRAHLQPLAAMRASMTGCWL